MATSSTNINKPKKLNSLFTKCLRHVTLEVQVMACNRHNNVAGSNTCIIHFISFEFWILKSYYILVHPSEFVLVIILVFCVEFLVLLVCFVLCLVCPMLSLSLDCPFLIVPSVFSNVYLLPMVCPVFCISNVSSISGLSILDCPFGFL